MSKWKLPPPGGHMDKPSGIYYQTMTKAEVEERLKVNDILLIPVGSTENHGAAQPFGEDTFLVTRMAEGPRKRLVTLSVDCDDRRAQPGSSAMRDGKAVGTVTSGDGGHRTGLNLALAFVAPEMSDVGTALHIDMLGTEFAAEVIPPCPYDPEFSLLRA